MVWNRNPPTIPFFFLFAVSFLSWGTWFSSTVSWTSQHYSTANFREGFFLVFFPSYKLQNRFSGLKFNEYKRIFHEKFICHANKQLPNCTNSYSTNRLSISLKLNISKIKLMSYIIWSKYKIYKKFWPFEQKIYGNSFILIK